MKRGLLISFSGVDGSGKSTQVELLQEKLAGMHVRSKRVWCRWRPITSLPLLMILRWLGYAKVHQTSSIGFVETRFPSDKGLASLWAFLMQVDNLLKTSAMVLIPLSLGRVVVCDRYVLDLIVEGTADMNDPKNASKIGLKILSLLPHPKTAFLVLVDPNIAYQRKPDMPTLSHFKARTELYRELAGDLGVIIIDGSKQPGVVHEDIWERIAGNWASRAGARG